MKKQVLVSILLAVLIALFAIACSSDDPMVGIWEFSSGDGIYFFWESELVEFSKDGTVFSSEDGDSGKWSTSGNNQLTVEADNGRVYEYTYQLSGDRLTITDEDGDRGVFQRMK